MKEVEGKLPLYTVLKKQFKNALTCVVERSEFGHRKYFETDQDYQNFRQHSVEEYSNALMRHLFEEGEGTEKEHMIATAWNALARLEIYLQDGN